VGAKSWYPRRRIPRYLTEKAGTSLEGHIKPARAISIRGGKCSAAGEWAWPTRRRPVLQEFEGRAS